MPPTLPLLTLHAFKASYLPPFNRASNPNRIYAWKNILAQARNYYFLEPCGPYIHLQHVGTHPQYLRQGAGAAVTRWGLELAERWKLRVGVFAGPMGALLCEGLGFEDVAELEVREGEGKRGVELLVMIWGLEGSRVESSGC